MSSISNFEETLGQKIAWLLDNGDDTHEMAKYLIASGAVADPAEVERLRGVIEAVERVLVNDPNWRENQGLHRTIRAELAEDGAR